MGETKQINIKNRSYYLYRNWIDLKKFWCRVFKNWQKVIQKHWYLLYWIQLTYKNWWLLDNFTVNPLYLDIAHASGYIEWNSIECNSVECNSIEENNGNKYLVLDDIYENKEVLEKYEEVWEGIKKEIETINGGEKIEYGKDF